MKMLILLFFKIDLMLAFLKHAVSEKYLITDYIISNKYIFSETGLFVVVDFLFILLPLWESVIVLCFVVRYFMSILVLQSS